MLNLCDTWAGHPNGSRFRSPNEFLPHLWWMMTGMFVIALFSVPYFHSIVRRTENGCIRSKEHQMHVFKLWERDPEASFDYRVERLNTKEFCS